MPPLAQNIVFVTDTVAQALEAPPNYAILFSADPAYQGWVPLLDQFRRQDRPFLGTWCDCRTTFPARAKALTAEHRLDTWCGQGETDAELLVALEAEAPLLVGNANAWFQTNRTQVTALINRGQLSFTQEAYTNAGWPWPEATSAAGVPAASLTIGLYDASSEQPGGRYVSVAEYRAHTPPSLWASICAYVSGLHPGELAQLPRGVVSPPPPPPPPPPAPPSATVVRREIANLAKAWEANNEGGNRKARISVARRVVDTGSTDARWNSVAGRIATLLDEAGIK